MRKRQFLVRLFYNTTFTVILIIEILLLLISPGDIVYQSFAATRTLSIVAVAIAYFLVLLISIFIIATRFYEAHTQLTAIPKSYVPIRKSDLSKAIRKLIGSELNRSTCIAYHAHPREIDQEDIDSLAKETARSKARTITWSLDHMKSWRDIQHPGWSSPCTIDIPSQQFEPILLELPHLIEAKAVSLAPPDHLLTDIAADGSGDVIADSRAVEVLQRSASTSLRQYLERLEILGMLSINGAVEDFLKQYEYTRFSKRLMLEDEFGKLIENFTSIVQNLNPPLTSELEQFVSISQGSCLVPSTSSLRSSASKKSLRRGDTTTIMSTARPTPAPWNDVRHSEMPTPMSRSLTPFLTPKAHMYQGSLSSGHAGDLSDSSDSDNAPSAFTAHTRPGRQTRTTNTSRHASTTTSAQRPSNHAEQARDGYSDDTSNDDGSVIHKTVTHQSNASVASEMSGETQDSIIRREDQASSTLPLPTAIDDASMHEVLRSPRE